MNLSTAMTKNTKIVIIKTKLSSNYFLVVIVLYVCKHGYVICIHYITCDLMNHFIPDIYQLCHVT